MNKYIILLGVCFLLLVGFSSPGRCQACKSKYSIDYVAEWSPTYNACNSEMKTTIDYDVTYPGAYKALRAEVYNTPFVREEWAGVLCPNPPCEGSLVNWTHCNTLENHKMMIDIVGGVGNYAGFNDLVLTAEYFAGSPD